MGTNARTTEMAEHAFDAAFSYLDRTPNPARASNQVQHDLYMAMGMQSIAQAIREVYDKLEQIDRKLSARP